MNKIDLHNLLMGNPTFIDIKVNNEVNNYYNLTDGLRKKLNELKNLIKKYKKYF